MDSLTVTTGLIAGVLLGDNTDWWALAATPFGWYRFNVGSSSWVPGQAASYQGSLFDLATFKVLNMTGLPIGPYAFYFDVDMVMNGSIDMGQIYSDSVDVTVEP